MGGLKNFTVESAKNSPEDIKSLDRFMRVIGLEVASFLPSSCAKPKGRVNGDW